MGITGKKNVYLEKTVKLWVSFILVLAMIFHMSAISVLAVAMPDGIISTAARSLNSSYNQGDQGVITYSISGNEVALDSSLTGDTQKEIVLVIDTSGSMQSSQISGKTFMEITKSAANSFVDKFAGKSNVKIGIVHYASEGRIKSALVPATNSTSLKNIINGLVADGATNTGDGLRLAYWMLNSSTNQSAKKYIVSMTDGDPTIRRILDKNNKIVNSGGYTTYWPYTSSSFELYTGNEADPPNTFHAGGCYTSSSLVGIMYKGSDTLTAYTKTSADWTNENERSLQYAELIGRMIKAAGNISSYLVGFSNGSGVSTDKLQRMAAASGAEQVASGRNYYYANNAADMANFYNTIADNIVNEVGVSAQFEETIPAGLKVDTVKLPNGFKANKQGDNWKVTGSWSKISLIRQSNQKYKINPGSITIPVIFETPGSYTLANNTAFLDYNIDGNAETKRIYFSAANVRVVDNTPPASPIISADKTALTNSDVNISISYSADSAVKEYKVGNGNWIAYTAPVAITLNNTIYARGTDAAGNVSAVASYNVSNIDKVPPANPTISINPAELTGKEVTVTISYTEDSYTKQYKIGIDGAWKNYTAPFRVSENITIYAKASDIVGNTSNETKFEIINIDQTVIANPNIQLSGGSDGKVYLYRNANGFDVFDITIKFELKRPVAELVLNLNHGFMLNNSSTIHGTLDSQSSFKNNIIANNEGSVLTGSGTDIKLSFTPNSDLYKAGSYEIKLTIDGGAAVQQNNIYLLDLTSIDYKKSINDSAVTVPVDLEPLQIIPLSKLL